MSDNFAVLKVIHLDIKVIQNVPLQRDISWVVLSDTILKNIYEKQHDHVVKMPVENYKNKLIQLILFGRDALDFINRQKNKTTIKRIHKLHNHEIDSNNKILRKIK